MPGTLQVVARWLFVMRLHLLVATLKTARVMVMEALAECVLLLVLVPSLHTSPPPPTQTPLCDPPDRQRQQDKGCLQGDADPRRDL